MTSRSSFTNTAAGEYSLNTRRSNSFCASQKFHAESVGFKDARIAVGPLRPDGCSSEKLTTWRTAVVFLEKIFWVRSTAVKRLLAGPMPSEVPSTKKPLGRVA